MMLQWSLTSRERRQIFWTAFCVLSLLEDHVFGDDPTFIPTESISSSRIPTTEVSKAASSTLLTGASTAPISTSKQTLRDFSDVTTSPSTATSAENVKFVTTSPTAGSTTSPHSNGTTNPPLASSAVPQNVSSTDQPSNFSDSPITAQAGDSNVMANITCLNIKQVTTSNVVCLKLNEIYSCQEFKEKKGDYFKNIVCEKKSNECDIKLADSELNKECVLLVEVNNKGADLLDDLLQTISGLTQLGIQYEIQGVENHKSSTRKTLIALITSGLLLAFLGLAGYYLMKRRSWSPMGERLGEDPYYTENGSRGNTVISVDSHEQSDLQDKPNLNGGARENGTGQPASKNGQSFKPHIVADTEL